MTIAKNDPAASTAVLPQQGPQAVPAGCAPDPRTVPSLQGVVWDYPHLFADAPPPAQPYVAGGNCLTCGLGCYWLAWAAVLAVICITIATGISTEDCSDSGSLCVGPPSWVWPLAAGLPISLMLYGIVSCCLGCVLGRPKLTTDEFRNRWNAAQSTPEWAVKVLVTCSHAERVRGHGSDGDRRTIHVVSHTATAYLGLANVQAVPSNLQLPEKGTQLTHWRSALSLEDTQSMNTMNQLVTTFVADNKRDERVVARLSLVPLDAAVTPYDGWQNVVASNDVSPGKFAAAALLLAGPCLATAWLATSSQYFVYLAKRGRVTGWVNLPNLPSAQQAFGAGGAAPVATAPVAAPGSSSSNNVPPYGQAGKHVGAEVL